VFELLNWRTNIRWYRSPVYLMEHINWLCCSLPRYSVVILLSRIPFSFFLFFSFPFNALLQLHTDVFTCFTALLLWCCVSFCSLLDGVCLSGNKTITYLLTYLLTSCRSLLQRDLLFQTNTLLNCERAMVMEVHVHARVRCFLRKYGTLIGRKLWKTKWRTLALSNNY